MTLSDKLLKRLAHDIRGAVGIVDMANKEVMSNTSSDLTRHRAMIDRGLARLTWIAELLSALGQASEGGIQVIRTPTSIGGLLARAHDRALAINPRKQVGVDLPDAKYSDLWVSVDEGWLALSLTEIEINAIKHAKARVRVTVERNDQNVEIAYGDDGPGFKPQVNIELPWAKESKADGIGLGLAKAAVEAHGGSLIVDRSPEGGGRVKVVLPVIA